MQKLLVRSERRDEKLVIAIDGELEASTCILADKEFEDVLHTDAKEIIVNCSDLRYISSAGIGALISFNHACSGKGICLRFTEMQPKVKNVLEILGIDKVFLIETSVDAL